ncbi:hypothetical protein LCGC14_3124140 [marine sediment metagenome]|uniref:Uncharacterized protein n=1 Tax=marine sediment metagenome TaxID=412755 RepID=A0A0F8YR78_9ZZZZ
MVRHIDKNNYKEIMFIENVILKDVELLEINVNVLNTLKIQKLLVLEIKDIETAIKNN